jgi:ribose transport system permease protein
VAIGQTIVIIAGGIDLSVGSVVKLLTLIAAGVMLGRDHWPCRPSSVLGVGCIIGLANGVVTRLKVPAFIATLGMY